MDKQSVKSFYEAAAQKDAALVHANSSEGVFIGRSKEHLKISVNYNHRKTETFSPAVGQQSVIWSSFSKGGFVLRLYSLNETHTDDNKRRNYISCNHLLLYLFL